MLVESGSLLSGKEVALAVRTLLKLRVPVGFGADGDDMKKYLSMALLAGSLLLGGCGDSDNFVFTNTNNNVLTAPVCADDAYTTDQDTALTVNAANGVLANDTPNGGTVTFAATSAQAGTIAGNADGSFTYTPPSSFTGDDSFAYTVANASGQSTCTVTITVEAVNGFFVDSVNGSDADGSFTGGIPFQTIQAAVAAAPTNADIVVLPGSYTGGINLKDGQRLLGSGSTLVSAQGATRPQLTGPVVMADGNTVDFLRIEGTNGSAVDGIGQDSGTVTNCEIEDITGGVMVAGFAGDNTRGTWTVSDNIFTNLSGAGVAFITTGVDAGIFTIHNNTMTGNGLSGVILVSEDTSNIRTSVVGNVMRGNNTVTGDALEVICTDSSSICLDLENNIADLDNDPGNGSDGVYRLAALTGGMADFAVEQLATLTEPQSGGAGNSGSISIDTGLGFFTPDDVIDGTCGF